MRQKPMVLPATEELIERIGWFIRLRWVAVVGILAFVELGRRILPIQFYLQPIYGILAVLVLYNLGASLLLMFVRRNTSNGVEQEPNRQAGAVARFLLPRVPSSVTYDREAGQAAVFASAQILADLVILAALLHFTGGVENPLRVFFLFHVIIASILLSRPATYVVATLGLLLFAAMVLGELTGALPHFSLQGHWRAEGYLDLHLVATQLFLLGTTLFVTAYMGTAIAVHLRKREVEVVMLSQRLEEDAERLQAAYEDVSAAERAKSQYMRKVAHELRGPLGTIKTALSVALDSTPGALADRTVDLIQRARHRAGELATMTQELLSLSRARGSRGSIELGSVNPGVIARKVMDDLRASAEDRGVSLTASVQENLGEMVGDAEGLTDVITNLLSNGIRYTPRGGRVSLALHATDGTLAIEVADTGIGIPQEDLPRIYDEFFRSKIAREFASDGSGLGMAIVKAVVDQHGGTIDLTSTVGRGTTVRVTLPTGADARGATL